MVVITIHFWEGDINCYVYCTKRKVYVSGVSYRPKSRWVVQDMMTMQ